MRKYSQYIFGLLLTLQATSLRAGDFAKSLSDDGTRWLFVQMERALKMEASDSDELLSKVQKDTNSGVLYQFLKSFRQKENLKEALENEFASINKDLSSKLESQGKLVPIFSENVDPITKFYTLYSIHRYATNSDKTAQKTNVQVRQFNGSQQLAKLNILIPDFSKKMKISDQTDLGLVDRQWIFSDKKVGDLQDLNFSNDGKQIILSFADNTKTSLEPNKKMNRLYTREREDKDGKLIFQIDSWPLHSKELEGRHVVTVQRDPETGRRTFEMRDSLGNVDSNTQQIIVDSPSLVLEAIEKTKVSLAPASKIEDLLPELKQLNTPSCRTI